MNPGESASSLASKNRQQAQSQPATGAKADNYYDILIKSTKKSKPLVHPRRINSQSSITDHFGHAVNDGNANNNLTTSVNSLPNPSNSFPNSTSGPAGSGTNLNTNSSISGTGTSGAPAKRPGDYYIQKLSSSSVNLPRRPISGDSVVSLNSNFSDEVSVNSSNFDPHDSRLSSLTSNSIISPNDSPNINSCKLDDSVNDSLSTITSDKARSAPARPAVTSVNSTPNISLVKKKSSNPKLDTPQNKSNHASRPPKANHNNNVRVNNSTVGNKSINNTSQSLPMSSIDSSIDSASNDSISIDSSSYRGKPMAMSTSNLSLTRTKTKYLSQEDIKKRQRLRKQQYEDSYNEDEILPNDMDLVFNVPVIKNQNELYMKKNIRNNLVDNDNYKPFPLPGKLRSNSSPSINQLSVNTSISDRLDHHEIPELSKGEEKMDDHLAESTQAYSQDIIEEEAGEDQGSIDDTSSGSNEQDNYYNGEFGDDSEIVNGISNYYSQRSKSYSKFVQLSRHDHMMYKLPKYIKSQSSIDDLNLMSPEKLMFVDQTRPINLPPKTTSDKARHNKEMHKMFNDFEKLNGSGFGIGDESNINEEIFCENDWEGLLKADDKKFCRRITQDKNMIRKLNWDTNCPGSERYEYFMKLFAASAASRNDDTAQSLMKAWTESFERLSEVYENLNESIKVNRDLEFNKLIGELFARPLIQSVVNGSLMDADVFKTSLKQLLYFKSLDNNLHKHDEVFLIPIVLIIFPNQTLLQQYIMVELLNHEIFNKEMIYSVNNNFENWNTKLPKKISKFLNNINLKEFDNLNFDNFFKLILQFNDKLPLSMSASNPSTPIMNLAYKKFMISSCSVELIYKFLQMLMIYNANPKTKMINHLKLFQSFLTVIVKYYHINWLDHNELIRNNKSIKLNFNMDNFVNLNSFNDKWKLVFKSV